MTEEGYSAMGSKYKDIFINELAPDGVVQYSKYFKDHKELEYFLGRGFQYGSARIRKERYIVSSRLTHKYYVIEQVDGKPVDYRQQVVDWYSMHEWPDGRIHYSGISQKLSEERLAKKKHKSFMVAELLRDIRIKYGNNLANAEGTREFKLLQKLMTEKRY